MTEPSKSESMLESDDISTLCVTRSDRLRPNTTFNRLYGTESDNTFALELEYTRTLYGEKIAIASIDEIKKLGIGTNTQHEQWLTDMKKIFPNVEEGQQLTGIFTPGQPSRFFFNGKPVGDVADPEFGPAFFGIWLHPKTSAPKLRQLLLNTK